MKTFLKCEANGGPNKKRKRQGKDREVKVDSRNKNARVILSFEAFQNGKGRVLLEKAILPKHSDGGVHLAPPGEGGGLSQLGERKKFYRDTLGSKLCMEITPNLWSVLGGSGWVPACS